MSGISRLLDEAGFRRLDYWEQWEELVADVQRFGKAAAFPYMLIHVAAGLGQIACIWYLTVRFDGDRTGLDFHDAFLKNLIALSFLTAFTGMGGMHEGPLMGEPVFPLTSYRFRTGMLKEPLLAFLGRKLNALDVCLSGAIVLDCILLLASPDPDSFCVLLHGVCMLALLLSDFASYIGSDGHLHGPLSLYLIFRYAFPEGTGALAGLQVWLLVTYLSAAMEKLGPWFGYRFAHEWSTASWLPGRAMARNIVYEKPSGASYTPAYLTRSVTRVWAVLLCTAPFSLLLTPSVLETWTSDAEDTSWLCRIPMRCGLAILLATHVHTILHLPTCDINMLGLLPAYLLYYAFVLASDGFSYEDAANMPTLLLGALALLSYLVLAGHLQPDSTSHSLCYRSCVGKWPQGFFLLFPPAVQKIQNAFGAGVDPSTGICKTRLGPVPWEFQANRYRLLAASWLASLSCRAAPRLFHIALNGRRLTDVQVHPHCFFLNQWAPSARSNCALRALHTLQAMQEDCRFDAGEVMYVRMDPFSSIVGDVARWEIHDARRGLIDAGHTTLTECCAATRPGFWKASGRK